MTPLCLSTAYCNGSSAFWPVPGFNRYTGIRIMGLKCVLLLTGVLFGGMHRQDLWRDASLMVFLYAFQLVVQELKHVREIRLPMFFRGSWFSPTLLQVAVHGVPAVIFRHYAFHGGCICLYRGRITDCGVSGYHPLSTHSANTFVEPISRKVMPG